MTATRGMAVAYGDVIRGEWTVQVIREPAGLRAVSEEWRCLYSRCSSATPFQSHAWLQSWWNSYGGKGRLRVFLVRHLGRLVGAAPLLVERRWGCSVLTPLGGALADFTDVLLDDTKAADASRVLTRALLAEPGWHVLDLREVRPVSSAHRLADQWPARHWRLPASTCLELPAADAAAFLKRFPGRTAGKMRSKLRKIDSYGISVTPVRPRDADRAVAELIALHRRQWQSRGVNPEHLLPRFRQHLSESATAMISEGLATIFEYRHDGRLIASDLVIVGHDFVGAYLYGAEPDLRKRLDVSLLLLRQDLGFALSLGVPRLNLLRGDELYKMKWRPERARNERILLPRSSAGVAYAVVVRARGVVLERVRRRKHAARHTAQC